MSCTTILAGKNATNDGSTLISRTDDGFFDVKKLIAVDPAKPGPLARQNKLLAKIYSANGKNKYKSVISHVEIELPKDGMRWTASPSVDPKNGIWAATGINAANVGMTATETITSNPRVLAADPLVELVKAEGNRKEVPGGIGEEDIVVLVLPYIKSAREGVERLASLLEKYGTYESNGIGFNDENEVWWLETIGGHHWMARRVPDDTVVINPNQFGMDTFDMNDAFGERKDFMCSADLREFISDNRLDLNQYGRAWTGEDDSVFNPRDVFGSHTDMDHVYNTPRAWFMGRYLAPYSYRWDGPLAEFSPESDNIPWSFVPDRKVAVEDIKYLLSAHYQGTPYDPYTNRDTGSRGMYRSIGINRTGVTGICQIRSGVPEAVKGVEWICYGSTTFSCLLPVYTNTGVMPAYLADVTLDASTENLYWASRMIGAMADHSYAACVQHIERYHNSVMAKGRRLLIEYDQKIAQAGSDAEKIDSLIREANEKLAAMAKKETAKALNRVLEESSKSMKNGYNLADN